MVSAAASATMPATRAFNEPWAHRCPGVTRATALRQARASPIGYTALLSLVAWPMKPGEPFAASSHHPHIETERHVARLCAVSGHQRRRRMGRRVPVPALGVPDTRDRVLVLSGAVARVLGELLRQRLRRVLPARAHTALHGHAGRRAILLGLVLPHCRHLPGRMGLAARGGRRWPARARLGGVLHAMAAPVRQLRRRPRQPRPHRGHGLCGHHVLRAVPHTAGGHSLPHPTRVPSAVRPGHRFEKPRDRPRPAHVRGRAARPSARVPHRGARLLAQRVLRGGARILHGHHALLGHRGAAGGSAGERAVHGRLARGGGDGAGAVAVQEPAHERGGRLSRGVPVRHHVVSAAAVPHGGVRAVARSHPVRCVQRGNRAHDDTVRTGIARPRHQPRVRVRVFRRRGVRIARRGGSSAGRSPSRSW